MALWGYKFWFVLYLICLCLLIFFKFNLTVRIYIQTYIHINEYWLYFIFSYRSLMFCYTALSELYRLVHEKKCIFYASIEQVVLNIKVNMYVGVFPNFDPFTHKNFLVTKISWLLSVFQVITALMWEEEQF